MSAFDPKRTFGIEAGEFTEPLTASGFALGCLGTPARLPSPGTPLKEKIFERFWRGPTSPRSGLGLLCGSILAAAYAPGPNPQRSGSQLLLVVNYAISFAEA